MATDQHPPACRQGFQCPVCGAWKQQGGCLEIRKCISALLAAESENLREVAVLALEWRMQQRRVLSAGLEALSLLRIGLLLCDDAGRVLGANRVAESILERRDGLELSSEGVLRAIQAERVLAAQREEVAKTERNGTQFQGATVLAIPRDAGRRPLTVFLCPSHMGLRASADIKSAVLVIVLDSTRPLRVITAELQQLYRFTTMEARLANLLMEGKKLDLCCRELGIRRSTGCTHLQRLFKKTGVHQQSELVALLWKSLGLARLAE